jgi:hypothetical protein
MMIDTHKLFQMPPIGALIVVQPEDNNGDREQRNSPPTWLLLARPSAPGDDSASLSRRAGFDSSALLSSASSDSLKECRDSVEEPVAAFLLSEALLEGSRDALQVSI